MLLCQITDLHIKAGGTRTYGVVDTAGMLRACVQHILDLPQRPDLVVATGDLVDLGRADEYALLRDLLAPLPMPVHLLPGNHDDRDVLRASFPDHAYLHEWPPFVQYVLEDHPVRIVALDSVIPREGGGRLCDERLEWLEATLAAAPGRPTIVVMHHPPFRTFIGHMDRIGLDGSDALARVIARHTQVERVLCGHLHRPIVARFAGTVASTCPSTAHQIALDLAEDGVEGFTLEPPGYQLHRWDAAAGVVSHTVAVGNWPGPYPFD